MHDLIRDMGREIVLQECHENPGKRSRLWSQEDILDVLTNHTGTEDVEGLMLNLRRSNDVQVDAQAFAKMYNLRLLELNHLHNLSGSYEHLPKRLSRLRLLCWFGFPLESIPSSLFMGNVVVIDMQYSHLKQVWKGKTVLNKLKLLNLSYSYHLTETPDFSGCANLEMLFLNDCTRLVKVHESIECLNKLLILEMKNCKKLRVLPWLGICKLESLQILDLSGCSEWGKTLGSNGSPSKLWFSFLPYSAMQVRNPDIIGISPASIKELNLAYCKLLCVPEVLGNLISLERLNLEGNNFCTLPTNIIQLSRLSVLHLSNCTRLQSLPELPLSLEVVTTWNCTTLKGIPFASDLRKSTLCFHGFNKLVENTSFRQSLASSFRQSLLQKKESSAVREFSILCHASMVPGTAIDYVNHQTVQSNSLYKGYSWNAMHSWRVQSVLSFVVPDRMILGWTLCLCIVGPRSGYRPYSYPAFYEFKNKTKGREVLYEPPAGSDNGCCEDWTWIHYAPNHSVPLSMEAGDEVAYVASVWSNTFLVREFSVNLIYEDDGEDYAIIQYAFPQHGNVLSISTNTPQNTSLSRIRNLFGLWDIQTNKPR